MYFNGQQKMSSLRQNSSNRAAANTVNNSSAATYADGTSGKSGAAGASSSSGPLPEWEDILTFPATPVRLSLCILYYSQILSFYFSYHSCASVESYASSSTASVCVP